jgi:hypothetical protein
MNTKTANDSLIKRIFDSRKYLLKAAAVSSFILLKACLGYNYPPEVNGNQTSEGYTIEAYDSTPWLSQILVMLPDSRYTFSHSCLLQEDASYTIPKSELDKLFPEGEDELKLHIIVTDGKNKETHFEATYKRE